MNDLDAKYAKYLEYKLIRKKNTHTQQLHIICVKL